MAPSATAHDGRGSEFPSLSRHSGLIHAYCLSFVHTHNYWQAAIFHVKDITGNQVHWQCICALRIGSR